MAHGERRRPLLALCLRALFASGEDLDGARSLRVSPEGEFDAWLPLAPGAYELCVEARWCDGRDEQASRSVHYEVSNAMEGHR
ncbi:MAG TPA: hypothetical protein VMS55_00510 [Myxococcota bacterium]|nr:hypothetical protein [Myxococcota bacterium]